MTIMSTVKNVTVNSYRGQGCLEEPEVGIGQVNPSGVSKGEHEKTFEFYQSDDLEIGLLLPCSRQEVDECQIFCAFIISLLRHTIRVTTVSLLQDTDASRLFLSEQGFLLPFE